MAGLLASIFLISLAALAAGELVRSRWALRRASEDRASRLRRSAALELQRRVTAARLGVAAEVHDAVAHQLVEINVLAGAAQYLGAGESRQALEVIKHVSGEALRDLRATLAVTSAREKLDGSGAATHRAAAAAPRPQARPAFELAGKASCEPA